MKIRDKKKGFFSFLADYGYAEFLLHSQLTVQIHCFTKNHQNSHPSPFFFFYLQLVVEISNFLKPIFINLSYYFFKNWQNSRLFETNCQNINLYRCCYFLNWRFCFAWIHIILPKIGKMSDFLLVILEILTFLAVDNF